MEEGKRQHDCRSEQEQQKTMKEGEEENGEQGKTGLKVTSRPPALAIQQRFSIVI